QLPPAPPSAEPTQSDGPAEPAQSAGPAAPRAASPAPAAHMAEPPPVEPPAADYPAPATAPALDGPIDAAALAGFSAAVVSDVIGLFLRDAPRHLAALQAAVARGDVETLRREAHALRGVAGTLGARELAAQAAQLEELA